MSKVLLVDTNFSSAPIYSFLVQSGHDVFVVGGNPRDFLAKSVRNYIELNYTNINQMRGLLEKLGIDFIVPGCNDRSYRVCAELNSGGDYCGLDTVEQTEIINRKDLFRSFADQCGLPVPRMIPQGEWGSVWPVIVKPVDAYSGRGTAVLHKGQKDDLAGAIERAREFSASRSCVVEEFIEGQLFSHSAFISKGEVVTDFIVEEHGTANPFVVDTSRVIHDFALDLLNRIRGSILQLVSRLNLGDGLVHTQFIRQGDSFWLIELTRRCPGDLYSQLIELSTGFKYAEMYARPFVQMAYPNSDSVGEPKWIMRHTISQPVSGVLGSLHFNHPVQIEKMVPLSLAGDTVQSSPFGRIALVFLKFENETSLLDLYNLTLQRRLYSVRENG